MQSPVEFGISLHGLKPHASGHSSPKQGSSFLTQMTYFVSALSAEAMLPSAKSTVHAFAAVEISVVDIVADVDKPGDIVRKYIEAGLNPEQYKDVVASRKKRITLTGDKESAKVAKADEEWFKAHYSEQDRMKIVRDSINDKEKDDKILGEYYNSDLSEK